MKKAKWIIYAIVCLAVISAPAVGWADKAAVEIEAPKTAKKGEEITVKLMVTHDGNNFLHYVDWVSLKVNGEEVQKWEYSNFDKPESEDFTIEYKVKVDGDLEIEAKAHCNNHGSDGPAKVTVKSE